MAHALSARDYLRIHEAAALLGVSEQTLRNWDRNGKLRAHRHPINGYRLYRTADLHNLLHEIERPEPEQLKLLPSTPSPDSPEVLPPAHWRAEVALDPKHRPQRWDAPSSTVRRDWRKYPQEAHVLDPTGTKYRRLSVEEIAILQGFDPSIVDVPGLTVRQRIAAVGDAVSPPLARAVLAGVDSVWRWGNRNALELCAGIGGLAEGASHIGLEHLRLVDNSEASATLLRHNRPWAPSSVQIADVRGIEYAAFRGEVGLLSGGPPCQPWSQSGQHHGVEDPRDLLSHLDAIVGAVEPEAFVFENVPGLATEVNEPYLRCVVERLRRPGPDLKYGVLVGMLNAADFGVPQVRRRIFIIGFRGKPSSLAGACFSKIESLRTHVDPTLPRRGRRPWVTVGEALSGRPDPGGWYRWPG